MFGLATNFHGISYFVFLDLDNSIQMYSSCEWLTRLTRLMTWDDNQSSHMIVCCQKSSRNNGIKFNVCFHFTLNYTEIPLKRSALTCFGQRLTTKTVSPSLCNKRTFVDIQKTSSTVNSIQIWTWFSMCSSPLAALYVEYVLFIVSFSGTCRGLF